MPNDEYEGLPVRKHSVAVRGASGDALNGALKVAPRDFHPGDRAFMVLEVNPADVNHKPMHEGEAWERVQVVRVERGCFVDGSVALPHLDEIERALEDLRAEESGQDALSATLKMEADHLGGKHRNKRAACPLCNPQTDEEHAKADELAAKRAEHGDGEGDGEHPLPGARTRRTRPKK